MDGSCLCSYFYDFNNYSKSSFKTADNAYDPDVSASELLIDHIDIRGIPCLIFLDNGAGMDRDHLLKMLRFV